jgi:oligopeptide/dipeptide ABC transporter ATP-binding protein
VSETAPLLDVRDLRVRMPGHDGPVAIVDGIDFSVAQGEIVGIAGESGSGKTMTALSLLGLHPKSAVVTGDASFGGRNLVTLGSRELRGVRGKEIAMVFQDPMNSLHPMLTISRQITEHMRKHLGLKKADAERRALALLEEVRIPEPDRAARAFPHQFSGGMRQRIMIAMSVACEPQLLIADEPTTALDVTVQAGILRLLDRLRRERQMAILLVTHDLGVISSLADRLIVFYAGRIAEAGPTRSLLASPRHPYTEQILLALPDPSEANRPLVTIAGMPATPHDRPSGCAFHPRCPYAEASCSETVPRQVEVAEGRWLACRVDPLNPSTQSGTDDSRTRV